MKVHNLLVTGSHTSSGEDIRLISSSVAATNLSQDNRIASLESAAISGTTITRLNSLETTTGSLNTYTSSVTTRLNSIETTTSSLNGFTSSTSPRLNSIEGKTGSFATTGSNIFVGNQTISGSIIPSVDNTYDLGSVTHQFRDLYLSSASLYIDGTKVLGSTAQELQITTDTGQSFKILEAGSDNITLQSADGNIELKSSGGGDVILDPTTGVIALKGTTTLYAGNKILSSDGNAIQIGNSTTITGSLIVTGFIETQELRTTYISSSILYRSGSTKFGDELTDTHTFTGSLLISGSLTATSITGSLFGTSSESISSSYPFVGNGSTVRSFNTLNNSMTESFIVGLNAGYNATGSWDLTAIGTRAAYQGYGAESLIAIGYQAGYQAEENRYSIFLGQEAGYQSTTYGSIYMGLSSGYGANADSANFIGYNAGIGATRADYSNFIGVLSGHYAENASGSNFIGGSSGKYQTGSAYSNYIGYNVANNRNSANYLGRNNIIIGNSLTLPTNSKDSINIGGLIFGSGSHWPDNNMVSDPFPFSGSANGKIGINQPLPQFNFDVSGSGRFTSNLTVTGSLTTTGDININSNGIFIDRSSSGEPYIFFKKNGTTRASIYARDNAEGLRFFSAQNDFSGSVNVTGSFITNNLNGSLGYKTARFSSNDDVNGTRILIDNTGNTINYGLFVGGSSQGAGTDKFSIGTLNTDYTYISRSLVVLDATGSLGLGTQTPTNTLHILGRSDNQLKIDVVSGGTFSSINFARNNVTSGVIGYNHNTNEFQVPYSNNASSYVVMYAGGAPKVTLKATGFMGVGTSDPQAKLHVDDGSVVVRTTPSTHSTYNWYSITDSHNTVRIKDGNELYIKKEVAGGSYGAFVLHPQTVGLNFDVTFDLTIGTPSSSYRHIAIAICSDGTNTTSNYDYIVLRHNVNDPSTNQIRIDVAGNTEQSYVSSAVPNFADGTQRRIQIRARNNFYVVEVDGSVIHSFMASARTRTNGKVGFAIYESTDANTYMYVRNFKIKDYSSERSVLYGWNTGEGLIGNKTQIRSNNSVTAMGRSYAHFPAPSANGAASIYLKNRRSYTKIQGYIRVRGGGSTDGWTNSGASISNDTFMDGIAITGFDSSGANETWIWGILCNNYDANEYAVNKPSFVGSNYSTFLTSHSTVNGLWLYTNDGSGRAPVRTFYFNRELGSALDGDIRIRIMSDQSPEDNEDAGIEEFGFNLIPANSNDFGNPENNKKLGEFIPAGTPIQVVAGSTTFSSGGSGNSVSLGTGCSGASPAWSCGIQIVSVKFTPKRANSLILIQTNNLAAWETSNASDHFYLFASNTEDGNVLVKSGMYLQNVGGIGGANGGIMCLNGSANSWGTTQKTISFRLGTTGSGSVYQYNPYYNAGGFDASTVGTFTYIITEIAQ